MVEFGTYINDLGTVVALPGLEAGPEGVENRQKQPPSRREFTVFSACAASIEGET